MNRPPSAKMRLFGFYFLLVAFCCAPVWSVEYFINQDGSAHLYSSYLMLELLKGNPSVSEIYALNSFSVPNSSGHWLMVLLFNFFSPFVITKIMVTLTFAGLVASVAWLRFKTVGLQGVKTAMLFGTAIAFNWLWLCGFYNFLIGVCCFVFTVGLIFAWRDKMNFWRTIILAALFLLAYFSHIVSFAVLAGSILLILLSAEKSNFTRNLISFFAALLPVLPLVLIYKTVSAGGGGFFPVWRNLENPLSPVSWLAQIRTADSFIVISRKTFPFVESNSKYFAVFTPLLWILAALFSLAAATFLKKGTFDFRSKPNLVFAFLFVSLISAAIFAPDDFGLTNGSILRERLLICGLIFFVPLFCSEHKPVLKRITQILLLFVVIFQTAALWEYSLRTNHQAKEFFAAQSALAPNEKIASIVLVEDSVRFNSTPTAMMNNYLGINSNRIVWDNYEIGHYLFPIIAKNAGDKRFIFDLTRHSALVMNNPNQNFDDRLAGLDSFLSENHPKIQSLIIWGKDSRLEAVLSKRYVAVYENGRVRVFRHR